MINRKMNFINDFIYIDYIDSLNGFLIRSIDDKNEINLLNKEKNYLQKYLKNIDLNLISYENRKALFFKLNKTKKLYSLKEFIYKDNIEKFLQIAINICKTLESLHKKNILHANLTKDSIFFDDELNIYIFNFSNAIDYEDNSTGISSVFFKKLALEEKSPEEIGRINNKVDLRSDIYNLGLILYQVLMGKLPFESKDELEILHQILTKKVPTLVGVPTNISNLILKTLEKNVLLRYQSISGVLHDLKVLEKNHEEIFDLGTHDISPKLQFPQKVYGRNSELEKLIQEYNLVQKGEKRTLFISGYSGVGKSSLIEELKNKIISSKTYFISSKFDQYNQNLPYFAIKESFSVLINQLLTKPQRELEVIKENLLQVLSGNGKVLIDIIPKLEEIIGTQAEVSELPANESENRFYNVFSSFIQTVATRQNPLVLAIDDLQWMDLATLKLLEKMINDSKLEYVFILSAYRDNEIETNFALKNILENNHNIKILHLEALKKSSLIEFLEDSIFLNKEKITPLVNEVYTKTAANPFFFKQFIKNLYEEKLLVFNYENSSWEYDIHKIKAQNITDNVASFMLKRISLIDKDILIYLQVASCLGATFDMKILQKVVKEPLLELLFKIKNVFTLGFIIPIDVDINDEEEINNSKTIKIKFLHDQVQQAIYSTIEEKQLFVMHHDIGRILLENQELNYFEILSHLNFSKSLLKTNKEKFELIELNLHAMNLAKKSTAYSSALIYLSYAKELLEEFELSRYHSSYVNILIDYVELLYLTSNFNLAKKYEKKLFKIIKNKNDEIKLRRVLTVQYTRIGKLDEAINEGLKSLSLLDVKISKDLTFEDVQNEIIEVQSLLRETSFSKIATLPKIKDENILKVLDILMEMQPSSYNSGSLIFPITILRLLKLTILHGNSELSYYIYTMYALMNTKVLKDYEMAFSASKYAKKIQKEVDNSILTGRVNMMLSNFIMPWQNKIIESSVLREQAYNECLDFGDYYWGIHSHIFGFYADFLISENLDDLYTKTKTTAKVSKKIEQVSQFYVCNMQLNLIDVLRGNLKNYKNLNHEKDFEQKALMEYDKQNYMCGRYAFIVSRLMQGFLFGNYQQALDVSLPKNLDMNSLDEGIFHEAFYKVFNILSILLLDIEGNLHNLEDKKRYYEYIEQTEPFIKIWKKNSPDVFICFDFLIKALFSQLKNHTSKAINSFEKSIEKANKTGLVFLQALCNELYGFFWQKKENEKIATLYFEEAILYYKKWKAYAKVEELQARTSSKVIARTNNNSLDLNLIVKSSNIISKEVKLDRLIRKVLEIVYKFSGAQNGFIFLTSEEIKLAAKIDEKTFKYYLNSKTIEDIPLSVVSYVKRTKEIFLLNDLSTSSIIFDDEYVRKYKPQAVLSIPLVLNDEVKGIIYLDNLDQKNIFTNENIETIKLLLSQIVTSFENAYFYEKLEDLVDLRTKDLQNTLSLFDMGEMLLFKWENEEDWPVSYVSNNIKEILGYEKSEFIEEKLRYESIIFEEDKQRVVDELLLASQNKKQTIAHQKYRLKHKNGTYLWFYDSTKIVYDKNGEISHYLGYLVDVTKEKQREGQVLLQTKMVALGEMISNIAHQWRQPLNLISTSVSSLKLKQELEILEDKELIEVSDLVLDTVTDLSKTIDDFRDFLSVDKTVFHNFSLKEIIEKACNLTKESFIQDDITIILNLDENLKIACSQSQLMQVFLNILNNSKDAFLIKDIKNPRLIKIDAYEKIDEVCIQISDNAGGISSSIINKIFEPYFTTKHQSQGTGLGLYLSHQIIVNELDGAISVRNKSLENKGEEYPGVSFKICLKNSDKK